MHGQDGELQMIDRPERRRSVLSDDDFDKIGEAFEKKLNGLFEVIGYDISTPETRTEIRKDHEFVRDSRKAKAIIIGAILTAVGTAIGSAAIGSDKIMKIIGAL